MPVTVLDVWESVPESGSGSEQIQFQFSESPVENAPASTASPTQTVSSGSAVFSHASISTRRLQLFANVVKFAPLLTTTRIALVVIGENRICRRTLLLLVTLPPGTGSQLLPDRY